MATPILNITTLTTNQADKETTINNSFIEIEKSIADSLSKNASGANITLTTAEWNRAIYFVVTGHTVARDLIVPLTKKLFAVSNTGTSAGILTVKGVTGSTVVIPIGESAVLYNNGTSVFSVANDAATVTTFLGLSDTPSSYSGQANKPVKVNSGATGLEFGSLNNMTAVTHPLVTSDNTAGYSVGSLWFNTFAQVMYLCADASTGAAVWKLISQSASPPFAAGSWFGERTSGSSSGGLTIAGDLLVAYPCRIRRGTLIDLMSVNVTAAAGAGTGLLGIYEDNNGLPGTLIAQSNTTFSLTATGSATVTFASNPTLNPPIVWLALLLSQAGTIASYLTNSNDPGFYTELMGGNNPAFLTTSTQANRRGRYEISRTYGLGMPATFGSGAYSSSPAPTLALRTA